MKISGYIKNSFVDYPGQISSVVFVPNCNLDCYFCHNRRLLDDPKENFNIKETLEDIKKRKGFVDGVVISGGEPTIYKDLKEFIREFKKMDFLVKLDSNGFNYDMIDSLLNENLVDYYAIDYKAPYSKYPDITGKDNIDVRIHEKVINRLIESDCEYEFRTTYLPELDINDMIEIAKKIKGAKNYYIQQFRPLNKNKDIIVDVRALKAPHEKEYVFKTRDEIKKYLKETKIGVRGVK